MGKVVSAQNLVEPGREGMTALEISARLKFLRFKELRFGRALRTNFIYFTNFLELIPHFLMVLILPVIEVNSNIQWLIFMHLH